MNNETGAKDAVNNIGFPVLPAMQIVVSKTDHNDLTITPGDGGAVSEPSADEAIPIAFSQDELAAKFSERYGQTFRYVGKWDKWYMFNGTHWEVESTGRVFDLIRKLCREICRVDNGELSPAQKQKLTSAQYIAGVEKLARTDRIHAATDDQWDQDANLLNTPGGIIDLATGKLLKHDPLKYLTKICSVTPLDLETPDWDAFIQKVQPSAEIREYLDRLCGYSITGSTEEQMLSFFYGTGANGKSLFLTVLIEILQNYAVAAPIELLVETQADRHPTEIARLRGARLVGLSETQSGRRWSEARIKSLTGGDKQVGRFMRQDYFEYVPHFKLCILGNHMPALRNVDHAISRRLQVVEWGVTITDKERDSKLIEKLRREYPGILYKWVRGCLAWRAGGLRPPAAVLDRTKEYLAGEDKLGLWLEECCNKSGFGSNDALYTSWTTWCTAQNEHQGTKIAFGRKLEERGFQRHTEHNAKGFKGLTAKPSPTGQNSQEASKAAAEAALRDFNDRP